ncbi:hypothetical protein CPB84DRAFT_1788131 [Gymnopilus junonius]|uniref:Uncharacterized protein n=1 Tax=Gymnopilus junonius TaxID=109634 RepID=A0A9P5TIR2_GYMJU|nr:hypothetical protein CPB84DRAFT_1788131 [Gymnopilus junonius]
MCLGVTAQTSFIGYPPDGASITPGKKLTVQVVRPNSIEGSIEAGLVIGLFSCFNGPAGCPGPEEVGTVLFNGKFKPTVHTGEQFQIYENFSLTVPSDFPAGAAQLSTNRFHLIGAGPAAVLEQHNITVNVA